MSIWLLRGREAIRLDGIRLLGRPPVLAPPAWALAERVWEGIGVQSEIAGPQPDCAGNIHPEDALATFLEAIPRRTRRLSLVVPDGTRVGAWRRILPAVLDGVRRSGMRRSLLIAGGVHDLMSAEALRRHLLPGRQDAEKLLEGWEVIQNGGNRFQDHRAVGRTPAGTPVRLHPAYLDADWRVLLGDISYHYFAGFGGGRKLVFPGMGEPEGIAVNHRRALLLSADVWNDPGRQGVDHLVWNPRCGPGLLEGNPVHEDLDAAARLAPPHWVVTTMEEPPEDPDPARPQPFSIRAVQGPYPAALTEAGAAYEGPRRISLTSAPSLVIADAGGEPRDATFLQAHKSLQHAARFSPPGGRVLLVAGCREGVGSVYLARYARDPERFRPLDGVAENPMSSVHVQTLTALRAAVTSRRLALWSTLPAETVRGLGMEAIASEEEAVIWCAGQSGASWGWLPKAERFLPAENPADSVFQHPVDPPGTRRNDG